MKVSEFKEVLRRLEELYEAAGATAQAGDLARVLRLLEGNETKTVDEFVAETRSLLTGERHRESVSIGVDEDRVAFHARRLLEAGTDQQAFQAALEALDQDKRLGKAEWFAIANRYRNAPTGGTHVYKYSTIKAARAAIRDVFIERFESESKRGILERLTRWAS
jgi:hypothetical protein